VRARSNVVRWKWRYHPPGLAVWITDRAYLCQWTTRLGFVYQSAFRWWRMGPREGRRQQVMDTVWEIQMKRKDKGSMSGVKYHAEPDKLLKAYPNLCEFLTAAAYEEEDGIREAPTLTLWAQSGRWKVSVRDRAEGLVMWLDGQSLLEVLQLLEMFVLEPEGPWRHDVNGEVRKGKRKRKGD
jgi:hypothetical protein